MQVGECHARERGQLQFRYQSASEEEGEDLCVFSSGLCASITCSSSRLGRDVFLVPTGQARVTHCSLLCVHVLGITDALSSLGRMWASYHHLFIVWGHVLHFCFRTLLPSKAAWFCG